MTDVRRIYRARPTDEEIADVLGKRLVATVGTSNEDGSIHLAYVIFLHEDGRVYFETSSTTRKARNAERLGRASVIVQGSASTGRQLMVSGEGDARLLRGDEARAVNHRIRAKYLKPEVVAEFDRAWNELDDVAVEVVPRRWRSWTGAVLAAETQRRISGSYGDAWLSDEE